DGRVAVEAAEVGDDGAMAAPPAPAPARDEESSQAASARAFRWFAAGVGSWFAGWGMNSSLFAWLVAGELRAEPAWVGVAQSSVMLPSLLFLLLGGAIADRVDPRRLLMGLHVLVAGPVLALAAAVAAGLLSIPALLAY